MCFLAQASILITFQQNRGKSESLLFFVSKPIKFLKRVFLKTSDMSEVSMEISVQAHQFDYSDLSKKDTVEEEKNRVLENTANNAEVKGLRVMNLWKTYKKYPFDITSDEDVVALKGVYFELEEGELLSLLGHNGAGKTTLIGVLSGMFEASKGTAQILNYNINQNIDEVRKQLGLCPQFDILWNQLTAAEHLRMYALIKGVVNVEKEIIDRLKDVDLMHVKDAQISTFSGGMKRRVSLAISAIGNPKIIILDEPTTGMDPKARRQVWEMIKRMKQGRVVLLTTHAMEEADALADRIAVMKEGEIKCIGTSLYLKNNFTDGYRVNVVCDQQKKEQVIHELNLLLPDCKILDSSGGSIVIGVPFQKMAQLQNFFEIIESKEEQKESNLKEHIKDWGLSHPTLEEVFRKLTQQT